METIRGMCLSSAPKGLNFFRQLPYCLYKSFLTSKVIQTPFRNQECPPSVLGGRSGDLADNVLFQYTEGPENFCTELPYCLYMSFFTYILILTRFKNQECPKDSLEEALKTHWSISSSSAARGLKFCTDLPQYSYFPFLTSIGIKPVLRNQECPPKLLGGNFGD